MKANELMIGDWVFFNGKPNKVTSLLVTDLGVDQIYVFGKTCQVATISEYIEPIPITPKILEKNGFVKYGDYYEWNNKLEKIIWFIEDGYTNITSMKNDAICDRKISNVHELQHVLRICGIEKQINL